MKVVRCPDPPRSEHACPSIFLAGPTPRDPSRASWRDEACEFLERSGFTGVLLHPQPPGGTAASVRRQAEWDWRAGEHADVIAFWIPRDLATMPGLTSNFEFGLWARSGKVVLGAPPDADEMDYLRASAELFAVPQAYSLPETLDRALAMLGAAAN